MHTFRYTLIPDELHCEFQSIAARALEFLCADNAIHFEQKRFARYHIIITFFAAFSAVCWRGVVCLLVVYEFTINNA